MHVPPSLPVLDSDASRDAWVDVLRGLVALLVVAHHTALMYGAIGAWFWHERTPDNSLSSLLLTFFCTLNQAWFMGLFFLLAGTYVPASLARKGVFRFLLDRSQRLGIPLLIFGYLLGPLTIALAFTSKGFPMQDTLMALWSRAQFESGPLWFVAALLVMTLLVTPIVSWFKQPSPFPTNTHMCVAALLVGVCAFLIRLVWPVGQSWWIGWQLAYFPSYLVLFTAGVVGASSRWWVEVPIQSERTWARVMRRVVWTFPLIAVAGSQFEWLGGSANGGWNVQAGVYAFWEPLVAWGVIMTLLRWAQQRFAHPTAFYQMIGRSAFTVYVIHSPIVVAVGLLLHGWEIPVLLKFFFSATLSMAISLILAKLLLRWSWWPLKK
jgi:peptidoglycan/LPS O-acetylase OafA/YrhL